MKKLSLFLVGLVACLAIGASTSRGQVMYSLQDLGIVKDMDYSMPRAINNQGHVAGIGAKYEGNGTCAFFWDGLIDDSGGVNSRGFGISAKNVVVGDALFGPAMEGRSHAATFYSDVVTDLGVLRSQVYSRANGINAMGQVVGYSGLRPDSAESRAFLWSKQTGMFDIGTLGGAHAQANAINDTGFITGTAQIGSATPITHAFIYNNNVAYGPVVPMRDLGVLGGNSSYGMAINSYNHVAGYSTFQTNSDRVHAFLHDGNRMIDLGSLGWKGTDTDVSVALGVNMFDQVVGYSYLPGAPGMPLQSVAFLWRRGRDGSGQMINLNRLLFGNGKHYLLTSATGINDNGQIVATAYDLRSGGVCAVLLTPEGPTPVGGN